LPERYETVIGERGANMSGGQRQRLAIARALLRKPEVLIFDEATSHLDTTTEQAIQKNLKTALAGKTVVLVAHRLSTIKDADLIYVLHQGRVAEQGSHRELLALGGRYAALCRAQSGADDNSANRFIGGERKLNRAIEPWTQRTDGSENDAPRLTSVETGPIAAARPAQSIFDLNLDEPTAPARPGQSIFDLQLDIK
jgi:ABC-type multidrug transport system ATPase subunit